MRDRIFPDVYLDYSPEQNQIGTDALLTVLRYILHRHPAARLIIDGKPFSRAHEIRNILSLIAEHGAETHVIHCDAPLDVIRARLQSGLSEVVNQRAERTPEKATRIYAEFEPIDVPHFKADMTLPLDLIVENVVLHTHIDRAGRNPAERKWCLMASVTLSNVRKRFGELETIHGVSIDIAEGEFVTLVGPSGCGKIDIAEDYLRP